MEIVLALAGLFALSPIMAAIAVTVKLHDGGPVLYRAKRVGRSGVPFYLFKFRSMKPGADRNGSGITVYSDHRVTPIGRILRRYKLDELPQLLNVVSGDMSFVGPRPEDPRYVALYTDAQRALLNYRPGITSPASLAFRKEEELLTGDDWEARYIQDVVPKKLAMELAYFPKRSLLGDLKLILQTVTEVAT